MVELAEKSGQSSTHSIVERESTAFASLPHSKPLSWLLSEDFQSEPFKEASVKIEKDLKDLWSEHFPTFSEY